MTEGNRASSTGKVDAFERCAHAVTESLQWAHCVKLHLRSQEATLVYCEQLVTFLDRHRDFLSYAIRNSEALEPARISSPGDTCAYDDAIDYSHGIFLSVTTVLFAHFERLNNVSPSRILFYGDGWNEVESIPFEDIQESWPSIVERIHFSTDVENCNVSLLHRRMKVEFSRAMNALKELTQSGAGNTEPPPHDRWMATADIAKALCVSDGTVTRYFGPLVDESKIQRNDIGGNRGYEWNIAECLPYVIAKWGEAKAEALKKAANRIT